MEKGMLIMAVILGLLGIALLGFIFTIIREYLKERRKR
jgi:hypothetical protein